MITIFAIIILLILLFCPAAHHRAFVAGGDPQYLGGGFPDIEDSMFDVGRTID